MTSPLAAKRSIDTEDLKQTGVMFIKKGWNERIDEFRSIYEKAGIKITDFDFFNLSAFNEAVKQNIPIVAISDWANVHPLLKIIPTKTDFTVPYGIMYSPTPSKHVLQFVKSVQTISKEKN